MLDAKAMYIWLFLNICIFVYEENVDKTVFYTLHLSEEWYHTLPMMHPTVIAGSLPLHHSDPA